MRNATHDAPIRSYVLPAMLRGTLGGSRIYADTKGHRVGDTHRATHATIPDRGSDSEEDTEEWTHRIDELDEDRETPDYRGDELGPTGEEAQEVEWYPCYSMK